MARLRARAVVVAILALVTLAGAGCARDSGTATQGGDPALAPAALRAAYVAARQAEGDTDPAYAARPLEGGALVTTHPATRMRAEMRSTGVTLSEAGEPWSVTLAGARVGCAGALAQMPHAMPLAGASANRVEYVRGAVTEWYAHGPLGLEQGFTLSENPCAGDLVIEIGVDGLSPAAQEQGGGVDLRDATGVTRMRYTDLSARDASGRALSAEMAIEGNAIALRVATSGAPFPVLVDPLVWVQKAELTASDGAADDYFGHSVSISGSTAIIGAFDKTVGSNAGQGAAYVFVQSGTSWTQQQKLVASDGARYDAFGSSVAVSGSTAIVGAQGKTVGSNPYQGAAYVFVQSGSTWTQHQELVASDGAAYDFFGHSVSVSGSTAIVGASSTAGPNETQGAAYVFLQSGSTWAQQQKLVASDGAVGDGFGVSVSVSGSTAIVGADSKAIGSNGAQGAAYVFVQSGSTWTQQQELVASDGAADDGFGVSVSVSGSTALIGASNKTIVSTGIPDQGAAYVFVQSGSTWTQQQELVASDAAGGDQFGASVSVSGSTAIVGADDRAIGSNGEQGVAYVFLQSGSTWTQQHELVASDGAAYDYFGSAVCISGSTAIVGALGKTVGANTTQGAAYVESYVLTNGSSCANAPSCVSGNCVDGVCCDTPCNTICQACTAALQAPGGADGTCGAAAAGTNPHNDPCGPDPASGCQRDGQCNGTGACQLYASGTACGSVCVTNSATSETCNGTGMCEAATSGTLCTPDQCVAGVCATSCATSADCDPTAYCDKAACVAKALQGAPCPTMDACAGTTACVDGYCCNTTCTSQCQACDLSGSLGTCTQVTGAPHGTRTACAGSGACEGSCTATGGPSACTFPTGMSCSSACSGGALTPSECDNRGECVTGTAAACLGSLLCASASTCKTSCVSASDCVSGYTCSGGKCTPSASGAKCIDGQTSQSAADTGDAGITDCAPYTCEQSTGKCQQMCTSVSDCVSPAVCNASGQCVAPPSSSSGGSGGCSFTPGASTEAGSWMLVGLALLATRRRRYER
jgi:MYXO-CTERM domain-containing protein